MLANVRMPLILLLLWLACQCQTALAQPPGGGAWALPSGQVPRLRFGAQPASYQAPASGDEEIDSSGSSTGNAAYGPTMDDDASTDAGSTTFGGGRGQPLESMGPVPTGEDYEDDYDPNGGWAPGPAAPTLSSGSCIYRGRWYLQMDAMYVDRTGPTRPIGLATDLASPNKDQLRTMPSLGYAPMVRVTSGLFLGRDAKNRDHSLEFQYMGPGNWHNSGGLTSLAPNGMFSLLDPAQSTAGFNAAHFYTYRYESNFNSYEINYRVRSRLGRDRMELARDGSWVRKCAPLPTPSFFVGIRNVVINERFHMAAIGFDSAMYNANYDVTSQNNLLGFQAGGDLMWTNCNWRAGFRGKAGPYINTTGQTSRVVIVDGFATANPADRNESAGLRTLSFVGEFGAVGMYQLRPRAAIRASWDLIMVNELTLAPNQMVFQIPVPPIASHTGFLLYQGASLGLELVW